MLKIAKGSSIDEYEDLKREKSICVWAFALDRLRSRFDPEHAAIFAETSPPLLPIEKVTAPHANNSNLHAQDGLFTLELYDLKGKLEGSVDRSPLELVVDKVLDSHTRYSTDLFFHRVRLSWQYVEHLHWRLLQADINKATIYPGYQGVVFAMQES